MWAVARLLLGRRNALAGIILHPPVADPLEELPVVNVLFLLASPVLPVLDHFGR